MSNETVTIGDITADSARCKEIATSMSSVLLEMCSKNEASLVVGFMQYGMMKAGLPVCVMPEVLEVVS